jgi:GTP-binding protein HflX
MNRYKTYLCFPIFKNVRFSQDEIFNQKNLISRVQETRSLVEALNASIIFEKIININIPKPSLLISETVAEDIKNNLNDDDVDLVIIDCSLSPIQHRNLERKLNKKVIDRTQLIIEIFGLRANTKEGMLQVELANLSFQKTRLVRSWTHLERQRGGLSKVGGPGESQIELDKRIINSKIKQLNKQLNKVKQSREIQRKLRLDQSNVIFSLVGYTNSGKSSIFNNLSSSNVLVKDMVFATLDTKMRMVALTNNKRIILSDTVGFISALPTELIDSFNASLEELFSSDYLLLVHDLSNPNIENQAKLVINTLLSIGFKEEELEKKIINIFNKADLNSNIDDIDVMFKHKNVITSAIGENGLDKLKIYLEDLLEENMSNIIFLVPYENQKVSSWLHKNCYVYEQSYCLDGFSGNKITAKITLEKLNSFKSNFPHIKTNKI